MPIFRLDRYPYVCRMCLQPEQSRKMTSLDTKDECFEGSATFEEFLAKITFPIEECKDLLRTIARFHAKIRNVHLFMDALVELRNFNTAPIKDLFNSKPGSVQTMLKELNLCANADFQAEDLIDEFPQFQVAQLPAASRDYHLDEEIKMEIEIEPEGVAESDKREANNAFAEECSLEEVVEEVTWEVVAEEASKVDVTQKEAAIDQTKLLDAVDNKAKKPTKKKPKFKANPITVANKRKRTNLELLNSLEPEERDLAPKAEEPLQCPKCPYKTIIKTHYHSHQLTHLRRENRTFPCKEQGCSEQFTTRAGLRVHMEANHVTCVCETCGQQCGSTSRLQDQMRRSHGNDRHPCGYCEKTFKVKNDLHTHVKNVHLLENLFKCDTCGMEFRRKVALKYHLATHSDVYNFPCQQCDKKFKIYPLLHNHVNRAHREASFKCEHCLRMFHTKSLWLDHIESVHEIQMRFVCEICVANFESQEKLAAHRARHDNPKKLECGQCLTAFPAPEPLADHMCITYREDYVCCGRDLFHFVQYNRHMFNKHGVKVNARVKPDLSLLLGQIRAKRKRILSCLKCGIILSTRTQKKQHQEKCLGGENKS
ncbi:hypothetical protein quinque_003922 [Culex quinquefasciatus]